MVETYTIIHEFPQQVGVLWVFQQAIIICFGAKSVVQRGNNKLRNNKQQRSDQTQGYTYFSRLDYSSIC